MMDDQKPDALRYCPLCRALHDVFLFLGTMQVMVCPWVPREHLLFFNTRYLRRL